MKLHFLAHLTSAVAAAPSLVQASSIRGSPWEPDLQECQFANTEAAPCCNFVGLGFGLLNFEAYPSYFRDDSTFTLAQAGVYTGPVAIEEYVKFVTAAFSPYFASQTSPQFDTKFKGFDGNICTFTTAFKSTFKFEKSVSGDDTEFTAAQVSNIYFNVNDNKIDKIDVYLTNKYLEFFFGTTSSDESNEFICGVMEDSCEFNIGTTKACVNRLSKALPVTENFYFDGNSQACRVLHSVLALGSPELHCPHISFKDVADPNGKVKCSTSDGIDPADLFDEGDLSFFGSFCTANGIDPADGYIILP